MSDEKCSCGTSHEDHEDQFRKHYPEYLTIRKAYEHATEVSPETMGVVVHALLESIADDNFDRAMGFAKLEGVSPREAAQTYTATMMKIAFVMGVSMHEFYGDRFGFVETVPEEEADELYKQRVEHKKANMVKIPAALAALRELGIEIPEGFDGEVKFVQVTPEMLAGIEEDSESASPTDTYKPPGMYL